MKTSCCEKTGISIETFVSQEANNMDMPNNSKWETHETSLPEWIIRRKCDRRKIIKPFLDLFSATSKNVAKYYIFLN